MKKLLFVSMLIAGTFSQASAAYIIIGGSFSADHQPPGATITCAGGGYCGTLDDVACTFTDPNGVPWNVKVGLPTDTDGPLAPHETQGLIEELHNAGVYMERIGD